MFLAITVGQDASDFYCVVGKTASNRLAKTFNNYKERLYKYRLEG